jgi:protein-tyrosine phosphatase
MKKLARFFPLVHNTLKFFGIKDALYKKDSNPIDHIIDNIFLGDFRTADNINLLREYNITHVINCAFNLPNKFPDQITYKRLELRDEPDQPIIERLEEAYQFIKENKDKNIFVHCVFGKSRSASVIIFYIMKEKKLSFNEAKDFVKNIRKIVDPNSGFENELNRYYEEHIKNDKDENNKIDENNNINEINEIKEK